MVVLVMLWSRTPPAWDEPSTGSPLVSLFLGVISWVFCRARKHGGC
jgi:hypothetical protein